MAEAVDIARYLIKLAAAEPEPEYLSHMRLQKLLYYVQGWSLAATSQPAFDSAIEAWAHGPVVRRVYPLFADYGDRPIPFHESSAHDLRKQIKNLVASVWEGYKQYSAFALRQKTHSEKPWQDARGDLSPDESSDAEITIGSMQKFFEDEYRKHQIPGLELEALRRAEQGVAEGKIVSLDELKQAI